MSLVLGSVIIIQILAHLPLTDIVLPANALQQFDIMIGFVSFDYFQPTEYFDVGFSEMPHWSPNFEWLGYGSINFVDGMGSIIFFVFFYILFSITVLFVSLCIKRIGSKWIKKNLTFGSFLNSFSTFIHGAFFEILVCVSISMKMMKFRDYLNS